MGIVGTSQFALSVVGFFCFCTLFLSSGCLGFKASLVVLQPNGGNATLWPGGTKDTSYDMRINAAGERELWIVGGDVLSASNNSYTHIRMYNIDKNEWTAEVGTTGVMVPKGRGPNCGVILHNSTFVLYGNPAHPDPFDTEPPVYLLDLATAVWTKVAATGGPPALRYPIVVRNPLDADEIIVYGGSILDNSTAQYKGFTIPTNDMYAFNIATSAWRQITYTGTVQPIKIQEHQGAVLGQSLWVFGGETCSGGASKCLSGDMERPTALFRFDFNTLSWTNVTTPSAFPQGRYGHSLVANADGTGLALFGGQINSDIFSNEIWLFNVASNNWTLVEIGYPNPVGSRGQILQPYATNELLLLMGYNGFVQPSYINRVNLLLVGPQANFTNTSTSSSLTENLHVLLNFPNDVPSLTFTPVSKCSNELATTKFMRLQINQIEELLAVNGDAHLAPVQRVDFLRGQYYINTTLSVGQAQNFDFSRNLGATKFGFKYSLIETPLTINYLDTKFQLQPSDIKFAMSVAEWNWALDYSVFKGSNLNLVLRTQMVIFANSPFTQLLQSHDDGSNQTIFTVRSQDVQMTLGFSDLVSIDGQVGHVKIFPYLYSDNVTFLVDLPYFAYNLTYDPDFSVVLNSDIDNDCSSDDQTLAIVLPTVLVTLAILTVLLVVSVGVVYVMWKKRSLRRRLTILQIHHDSSDGKEAEDDML